MHLAQNRNQWRVLLSMLMNLMNRHLTFLTLGEFCIFHSTFLDVRQEHEIF
jgi:hypothetical protein